MKTSSLLSRERAEEIFERHKKALAHDGSLSPVIYISLQEVNNGVSTAIEQKVALRKFITIRG